MEEAADFVSVVDEIRKFIGKPIMIDLDEIIEVPLGPSVTKFGESDTDFSSFALSIAVDVSDA